MGIYVKNKQQKTGKVGEIETVALHGVPFFVLSILSMSDVLVAEIPGKAVKRLTAQQTRAMSGVLYWDFFCGSMSHFFQPSHGTIVVFLPDKLPSY